MKAKIFFFNSLSLLPPHPQEDIQITTCDFYHLVFFNLK